MGKDYNTALAKGVEVDRVKLTRRRKQILRELGLSEDLDSTELAEKLHEQTLANDALNRSLARKDDEIRQKDVRIAELEARVSALEGGKKPAAKTNGNSSVPPSKNPIGVPHTQSQRKPSGKKTGGQPGHEGSTRLQAEDVSGSEKWFPQSVRPDAARNSICPRPPSGPSGRWWTSPSPSRRTLSTISACR